MLNATLFGPCLIGCSISFQYGPIRSNPSNPVQSVQSGPSGVLIYQFRINPIPRIHPPPVRYSQSGYLKTHTRDSCFNTQGCVWQYRCATALKVRLMFETYVYYIGPRSRVLEYHRRHRNVVNQTPVKHGLFHLSTMYILMTTDEINSRQAYRQPLQHLRRAQLQQLFASMVVGCVNRRNLCRRYARDKRSSRQRKR
jgi:hypothetical protein